MINRVRAGQLLLAALFAASPMTLARGQDFLLTDAPKIHQLIWDAQASISEWLTDADSNCLVALPWKKPRQAGTLGVRWTGPCSDVGLAHGGGDLSLLYDGIEIFTETFDPAAGSMLYEGVPMTTLTPDEFGIQQSTCLDAGLSLKGHRRGGTFAEYPARAQPNFWTLAQDAVVMEQADSVVCNGRLFELRVFTRGDDILATVTGTTAKLARVLNGGYDVSYLPFAKRFNAGIDRYNVEIVAVRERQAGEARQVAAASYADANVPIENLANFLEAMGKVKSIEQLSAGRLLRFPMGEISFKGGRVYATHHFSPDSAAKAVSDLQQDFSWDGWFDVTVGGNNSMSRAMQVVCIFETADLAKVQDQAEIVVRGRLEELSGGGVVLQCAPN